MDDRLNAVCRKLLEKEERRAGTHPAMELAEEVLWEAKELPHTIQREAESLRQELADLQTRPQKEATKRLLVRQGTVDTPECDLVAEVEASESLTGAGLAILQQLYWAMAQPGDE